MEKMNPKSDMDREDIAQKNHADLKWAAAYTTSCGSEMSCIKEGTCLGRPVCKARTAMGKTAGFVAPTESSEACGYCVPVFHGHVCFCPTRWALFRAETRGS